MRLEVGPMDIQKGQFVMAKRNILDTKAGKARRAGGGCCHIESCFFDMMG